MTLIPRSTSYLAEVPRPLALLGFGVEGRETLRFLLRHGVEGVRVCDISFESGLPEDKSEFSAARFDGEPGWQDRLAECGTVIRSAGVRPDVAPLVLAREAEAQVTTAIQLFLALRIGEVIGVTGTLGKGTTVTLIGEALRECGIPYRLGGNFGLNPLAFVEELTPETVTVLELSSFQLMDLRSHHPEVAVVLRTTSEHLDWHQDVAEYRQAKRGLLAPADSAQRVIFCADSEGSREVVAGHDDAAWAVSLLNPVAEGIGLADGHLQRFREGGGEPLPALERLSLAGAFNRENAAAAALAVEACGAEREAALRGIGAFAGLPHRLERVGSVGPVVCFNDSYATRPDATLGAVGAFTEPLVLIAGGSEKHADFGALMGALCSHPSLKLLVLMGTTAPRMLKDLRAAAARLGGEPPPHKIADGLDSAFGMGLAALPSGGVLLMSPACASFDMFPNYTVRGERFRGMVREAGTGSLDSA